MAAIERDTVTVAQLIEELRKLPQDALVYAMTRVGPYPAHAHLHASGDVHVLGRLNPHDAACETGSASKEAG